MTKIEFRLLQVILSPVSGDRITLALLHWDGRTLRVTSSMAGLIACEPAHREGIRMAAEDIVRQAHRTSARVEKEPLLDVGLAHVFPVREGLGAALYWTPITTLRSADAVAHFAELRQELRLDRDRSGTSKRLSTKRVQQYVLRLGETLKVEEPIGSHVWVDHEVRSKLAYRAPLSWKNGALHHALPFSFDCAQHAEMVRLVEYIYGLVSLSIPSGDVPVLVPVLPKEPERAAEATSELRVLRTEIASHRVVDVVIPEWRGSSLSLDELATRVRKDVLGHTSKN